MKSKWLSVLKVAAPLLLGLFLVWYVFNQLSPGDFEEIKAAFGRANYGFVGLSVLLAILSHLLRAYRWKYTLQPLGHKADLINSFFSVMSGYLVNLGIPRLGELTRCTVMSRYSKLPFNKLFGTVIAERAADMIVLMGFMGAALILQFDNIMTLLRPTSFYRTLQNPLLIGIIALVLVAVTWIVYRILKISVHPFALKIKGLIKGVFEGIRTIVTMEGKWAFIFYTFMIWLLYYGMFHVTFFAFSETSGVQFSGILTAFVVGGLSIAATNGGIGAYPLGIQQILLMYAVSANTGLALGWLVWSAQTLMIIALGSLSFALIPIYNRLQNGTNPANGST